MTKTFSLMKCHIFVLLSLTVRQSQGRDGCPSGGDYLCGDVCIPLKRTCTCGGDTQYGNAGLPSSYCCLPAISLPANKNQCQRVRTNGKCSDGNVTNLTEPCGGECFTEYRTLRNQSYLGGLRATYKCESGDCVLMRDMCSGYATCQDKSDLAECDESLHCISTNGGYERTSYQGHYACLYYNAKNDREYDNIHRKDEETLTVNLTRVNFSGITQRANCSRLIDVGLTCGDQCSPPYQWCLDRSKFSVKTHSCPGNVTLPSDDKSLCKNKTFWSEKDRNTTAFLNKPGLCDNVTVTCDMCDLFYPSGGELYANGSRCTGNLQHCYYPWYTFNWNVYTRQKYAPTCSDNSDKIFHINSRCNTSHYVDIYCDTICRPGKELEYCNREICDVRTVSQWLEDNKDDKLLMDPHDCQSSCSSPGPDCEACTNTDYFRCTDGATCLHPDLLCDGHQHCQDGSDEDFDFCYFKSQLYLKKNIVEEFATLVCHSKMYPLIFTVATVCDGIRECYGDKDEPPSCTNSIAADIGISCIVIITIAFYFLQKWILEYFVTSPDNGTEDIELEDTEFEKEELYMALHAREDFQYRINCYLARLKYSKDAPKVEERINLIREGF